jgi:hypothetical protein
MRLELRAEKALELKYEKLLSRSSFNVNFRRYVEVALAEKASVLLPLLTGVSLSFVGDNEATNAAVSKAVATVWPRRYCSPLSHVIACPQTSR